MKFLLVAIFPSLTPTPDVRAVNWLSYDQCIEAKQVWQDAAAQIVVDCRANSGKETLVITPGKKPLESENDH